MQFTNLEHLIDSFPTEIFMTYFANATKCTLDKPSYHLNSLGGTQSLWSKL